MASCCMILAMMTSTMPDRMGNASNLKAQCIGRRSLFQLNVLDIILLLLLEVSFGYWKPDVRLPEEGNVPSTGKTGRGGCFVGSGEAA
mmetsp:Transcript_25038/g.45971  ORF Transcript_25038/g.45971 Transcript_25038/m.45971 type:complete len:88 (-) Transcript_25038:197-460(-)